MHHDTEAVRQRLREISPDLDRYVYQIANLIDEEYAAGRLDERKEWMAERREERSGVWVDGVEL